MKARFRIAIGVALCASLLPILLAASGQPVGKADKAKDTPKRLDQLAGITSPNRTATLAALQPSRIVRIEAAEGQLVQKGNLLVALDDGVQRVRTEMARTKAESLLEVELAIARMQQAVADLEHLRKLEGKDSTTDVEIREAETKAEETRLAYEVAKFERHQAASEYEYQKLILERLHLRAPFSGYVTQVLRETGETVTESEPILQIVELDPLEISIDCPLKLARTVRVGERVYVRPADPQWESRVGLIVLASRVAEPGSQTFKVKLIVPNQDADWKSGLKVYVDFASSVPVENARLGEASLNFPQEGKLPAATVSKP